MEERASSDLRFIGMWNISFIIMWPLHNQSYCNISMKNGSNVIINRYNSIYPAMTAFTDQYSLPWYWSVINRTYKCKLRPLRNYFLFLALQNVNKYGKYFYHRPVNVYLRFKIVTCALPKHICKYVYSARNAGKGSNIKSNKFYLKSKYL
jgi:hypothetical protein